MDVLVFMRPFKGVFKGVRYDSARPPSRVYSNYQSCAVFTRFISETLEERLVTGAVQLWGRVGEVKPPLLVLPMTVEPSKPRLCIDARFLNLWMRDTPFTLDKLVDVPRYVYPDSFMSKNR